MRDRLLLASSAVSKNASQPPGAGHLNPRPPGATVADGPEARKLGAGGGAGTGAESKGTRSAAPSPSTPPFSRTAGVKCREKLFEDYATARGDLQGSKWFGVKGKDGSFT